MRHDTSFIDRGDGVMDKAPDRLRSLPPFPVDVIQADPNGFTAMLFAAGREMPRHEARRSQIAQPPQALAGDNLYAAGSGIVC
jgi:hypothetical protein